ncbi:DUF7504 family protein [Haladaptatus sp. DFWS20]|uniref:DUF7504 family protein n=1 Tax=Haladaptatus sp. DFWS20 TaxID=3403467 RepID=UPI003EBA8C9D
MNSEVRFRGEDDHITFQSWLHRLKRQGSNVLVTGNVPDAVSANASRIFFGRHHRYRILARIDRTISSPESRLPESTSVESSTTWVLDQRNGERSIPTAATPIASHLELPEKDNVCQLRAEIQTAISFFEERADGFDPAELRVGVDSLFPFVQRDLSMTKQTLRTLAATVRGVRGMGHYHLRVGDNEEIVEELTPLFDARIELRKRPGVQPEQRWHVPKLGKTTVWVKL